MLCKLLLLTMSIISSLLAGVRNKEFGLGLDRYSVNLHVGEDCEGSMLLARLGPIFVK